MTWGELRSGKKCDSKVGRNEVTWAMMRWGEVRWAIMRWGDITTGGMMRDGVRSGTWDEKGWGISCALEMRTAPDYSEWKRQAGVDSWLQTAAYMWQCSHQSPFPATHSECQPFCVLIVCITVLPLVDHTTCNGSMNSSKQITNGFFGFTLLDKLAVVWAQAKSLPKRQRLTMIYILVSIYMRFRRRTWNTYTKTRNSFSDSGFVFEFLSKSFGWATWLTWLQWNTEGYQRQHSRHLKPTIFLKFRGVWVATIFQNFVFFVAPITFQIFLPFGSAWGLARGRGSWGYTPLHLAAGNGHVGVVQRLLEAKAVVDAESNKFGRGLGRGFGGNLLRDVIVRKWRKCW